MYLPDCGHCIEVEGMDYWMNIDEDRVEMKCCPRCKTVINLCFRYGNIMRKNFKGIVIVKNRQFQAVPSPELFINNVAPKMKQLKDSLSTLKGRLDQKIGESLNSLLDSVNQQMKPRISNKKPVYKLDGDLQNTVQIKIDVVKRMLDLLERTMPAAPVQRRSDLHTPATTSNQVQQVTIRPELLAEFHGRIQILLDSLSNRSRATYVEYESMVSELDRLEFLRAFYVLKSVAVYPTVAAGEKHEIVTLLTRNVRKLDERDKNRLRGLMRSLDEKLQSGLKISREEERRIVMNAVGLRQGNWFMSEMDIPTRLESADRLRKRPFASSAEYKSAGATSLLRHIKN